MCGHTKRDKIKNKDIWDKVRMISVVDKMQEVGVKMVWYVIRRCTDALVRRCERLAMDGFRRGRGRPKKYWRE